MAKKEKKIVGRSTFMTGTAKPKGLKIDRSGGNFVASWKIGDADYGQGQWLKYRVQANGKWGGWTAIDITKTTTKKAIPVSLSNYFPNKSGGKYKAKLNAIEVSVKGRRKKYTKNSVTYEPETSDETHYTYSVTAPNKQKSLAATLSETYANVCTFAWDTDGNDTNNKILTDVEWQTVLVKNSNETKGENITFNSSKLGWQTGTKSKTNSVVITEESELTATDAYVRWFRTRSRGPAGNSANKDKDWSYTRHIYSMSYPATIKSAKVTLKDSGGYLCTIKWEAKTDACHPIDSTTVRYAFATPDPGMECPDGASWTDAVVLKDTAGDDGASFSIESSVGYDQCLFVQVNTMHDNVPIYGIPKIAAVGPLTAPSDLSVVVDSETYRATITANNNSDVSDSFLGIVFMTKDDPEGHYVGIKTGSASVTVQCPAWSSASDISFGVRAIVGTYEAVTVPDGSDCYNIMEEMQSVLVTDGGTIPVAPTSVALRQTGVVGTVQVTFDWAWNTANSAELSWSDHADAWESTDEPETFVINNTHAARWNISGLDTGTTWYVRVRLMRQTGDDETYGPYSDIVSIDLSSAPAIPVLSLDKSVITEDGDVTASWVYVSTDGTAQAYAEVCEVMDASQIDETYVETTDTFVHEYKTYYTRTGSGTTQSPYVYTAVSSPASDPATAGYYEENIRLLAHTETEQYVTINAKDVEWYTGEEHALVVKVVSASGKESQGWSEPVTVLVAEPLECIIASHSLVSQTITVDSVTRTILALTEMPLSATVTGAGEGGTTTLVIERSQAYHMERPDETDYNGFEGETIYINSQPGETPFSVQQTDLLANSYLDDGAGYTLIATVQDGLGQTAEARLDFEVHWSHQAIIPEATFTVDNNNLVVMITPEEPEGAMVGDVCDIYRLSVDRPQLIYENAEFDETYVDPFPAIGDFGGHRIVYKTANGDYITTVEDVGETIAWLDLDDDDGDIVDSDFNIINFGNNAVMFQYNIDLDSAWEKDFIQTKYLGGSIQGDWNPAVSRTGSVKSVVIEAYDFETIIALRRLADYAGICHVRTKDGSSYAADVQVSESRPQSGAHNIVEFSLNITRVDPQTLDGVILAEWEEFQPEPVGTSEGS